MGRCGGDEKNEWPRRTDKIVVKISSCFPIVFLSLYSYTIFYWYSKPQLFVYCLSIMEKRMWEWLQKESMCYWIKKQIVTFHIHPLTWEMESMCKLKEHYSVSCNCFQSLFANSWEAHRDWPERTGVYAGWQKSVPSQGSRELYQVSQGRQWE